MWQESLLTSDPPSHKHQFIQYASPEVCAERPLYVLIMGEARGAAESRSGGAH